MSSRFKELFEEAKHPEKPAIRKISEEAIRGKHLDSNVEPVKVKGKRNNPDYTGAFAYIPAQLHEDVKIKLLRKKDLDFSLLVECLLAKWLDEEK